jgi:hypothetical protein
MLVDFDWRSKHSSSDARYIVSINTTNIQWPKGVEKGALMWKKCDPEMFAKLFVYHLSR